jgi:hypothetical protein
MCSSSGGGQLLGACNVAGVFAALGLAVSDTLELENGNSNNDQQGNEGQDNRQRDVVFHG